MFGGGANPPWSVYLSDWFISDNPLHQTEVYKNYVIGGIQK